MVQLVVQKQGTFVAPTETIPSVGDVVSGGVVFKVIGSKVYVSAQADLSSTNQ